MRNMVTGDLTRFMVKAWLSKTKDDKQIVRDIAATVKGKEVVNSEYQLINVGCVYFG